MSFFDTITAALAEIGFDSYTEFVSTLRDRLTGKANTHQESNGGLTPLSKVMMNRIGVADQWGTNIGDKVALSGLFAPRVPVDIPAPHPCQDIGFPFLYDPSTDEYIGFRWDYGDVSPLVPPLTPDVLATLGGLYLSPSSTDYYCSHGGNWSARFTVVAFKKPQYYRSMQPALQTNRLIQGCQLTDEGERSGQYMRYNLHPQAASLAAVGYGAILSHAAPYGDPGELFLFDPKTQVTRTSWTQWGN